MKHLGILLFIILVGLISLACGTVRVDLQTTVEKSGDIAQEGKLVASGLVAGFFKEQAKGVEEYKKEGWLVQIKASADSFEQTWKRTYKRGETLDIVVFPDVVFPDTATEVKADGEPKITYYMRDLIFLKDYDLRIELPPSPDFQSELQKIDREAEQIARAMLESMFSLSWTIIVPGKIVSTNADRWEKNSATWDLNLAALEEGRQLDLKARYINWPLIVGAGSGIAVLVIGTIVGVRLVRRRKLEVR